MRASPEALLDAGVRAVAVNKGGKCWSIDTERAAAVAVMQGGGAAGAAAAAAAQSPDKEAAPVAR